jgi:SAM-dependent methyltransferase
MRGVDYDGWAAYLAGLLAENGVAEGGAVLDCACGTGELTLRLAGRGYAMTGIDRSEEMLAVAAEKARKAGRKVPFVRQDMRRLCVHKPADAIVCACDGVNYLLSAADVAAFFKSAANVLSEGGLLLFDVSSAYKLAHVLGGRTYGEDTEACTYLWQNAFDPKSRLLEMDLVFFTKDETGLYMRFDETHIQRAHEAAELCAALQKNGFSLLGVYDAFTRDEPKRESERIQFAARKATGV